MFSCVRVVHPEQQVEAAVHRLLAAALQRHRPLLRRHPPQDPAVQPHHQTAQPPARPGQPGQRAEATSCPESRGEELSTGPCLISQCPEKAPPSRAIFLLKEFSQIRIYYNTMLNGKQVFKHSKFT